VDASLVHRIDNRDAPQDWTSQIVELGAKTPGEKPAWSSGTEVYNLNPDLIATALEATKDVALADSNEAAAYRANYAQTAAKAAPKVIVCTSVSSDTYWHGVTIAKEVSDHTSLLTNGAGDYCMSQMEDNATMTALTRAAEAGRLDMDRVAVLRTASNFDRAYDGQGTAESLAASSGGFGPATENAYRVGHTFASSIISDWDQFSKGIPAK
jgi:purine nucleoside permease